MTDLVKLLRDTDSYYRIQEKHWCIDHEELERQRLAAADLIETQAREIERLGVIAQGNASIVCKILDEKDAEIERLRAALEAYAVHCSICSGGGSIVEEDSATGALLWRDCPGCTPARAALAGDSHDQ